MASIKELSKKIDLIKKQEKNKKCFDCGEKGTTYVCLDFGTFICSRCAGLLRDLNYRVKGTSVSIFNQREIEIIEKNGNEIAQKIWMAKYRKDKDKEPNSKDDESLKIFLSIKYKDKRWYKKPKHTIKKENEKKDNKNETEYSDDDEEENESESESEEENKKEGRKKVVMNSKKDESDNERNDSDEESYDGENKKDIKEDKENKETNEDDENSSSDEEKQEQEGDNPKKTENQNDIKNQMKYKSNFKLKKPTNNIKNSQNNKKIKKNSKTKKEVKNKNKKEEEEEKNDKQEEDEFYSVGENQDNKNCNKKNINEKPIQSVENNYYLLDIFSTPYNTGNQNTFVNNMNTFNFTQGANQSPQQQNNNQIFQGYDFTNVNIPENKERIEQQKRIDKLENALNNLIISNQYKNMNMNTTNLGYNMVDDMYINPHKMMYNNNYIPINNYNYMNNMHNMHNNFVPFGDLNFAKDNQLNNGINNPQYKTTNNPFSFI